MVTKARKVMLVLLLATIFGSALGMHGFWEKDEARYAQAAREMRRAENMLVPTLRGEVRLNKPPLFYWLIAAGQETLGENELAARFPSAICAVLTSLLIFSLARRLAGEGAGWAAALIYATCGYGTGFARLAHPEVLLSLGVTGALVTFYGAYRDGLEGRKPLVAMWLFVGLAVFGKGPHGALLPILVILVFLAARRDLGAWKRLMPGRGILIAAAPVLIWVAAVVAKEGAWVLDLWWDETIGRASGAQDYHPQGPFFFVPKLLGGFAPWVLFAPLAWAGWRRDDRPPQGATFLLVWAAAVFLFFSALANKASAYMLSVMPPLAVLTGIGLSRIRPGKALRGTGVFFGLLAVALLTALPLVNLPQDIAFPAGSIEVMAAVATLYLAAVAVAALFGRPRTTVAISIAGTVALVLAFLVLIAPAFEPFHSLRPAGRAIADRIEPADLLVNLGTRRAGLVWYSDHPVERELEVEDLLPIWNAPRRIFVYAKRRDRDRLEAEGGIHTRLLWSHPRRSYVVFSNR